MDWYYVLDNKWNGPHSQDKIAALLRSGKIDGETKVWREGLANWTPAGSVEELRVALESIHSPERSEDQDAAPIEEHAEPIQQSKTSPAKIDNAGLSLPEIIAESFIGETDRDPIEAHPLAWDEKVERIFTGSKVRSAGKNWRSVVVFAAVVLGISGSMLVTWLAVQPGKDAREAQQREASKAAREFALTAGQPWMNPVTGLSANMPSGWIHKTKRRKNGRSFYSFHSPDRSKVIYVEAHRNTPDHIDMKQFERHVVKHDSRRLTFSGNWRPVLIGKKSLMLHDAESIGRRVPVSYFIFRNGRTFWRLIAFNATRGDRSDPAQWPVIAALVGTLS